ncbi:MAG: aminoglycoside phosphotransferase family protein [Candidatus Algichlamydia australiensis]|nr:aminoglycoside phosphotransferase family protein [Chlamydiales bacterium]
MKKSTHLFISCLKSFYQIEVSSLIFIPVGADIHASLFKIESTDQKIYFVKVRRGPFHDGSTEILELLRKNGVQHLIQPVKTIDGKLTQQTGDFTLIVYPFIQGQNGFSRSLSDNHWISLGKTLKQIHEIPLPPLFQKGIPRESFSPKSRNFVESLYKTKSVYKNDPISVSLWTFLQENKPAILQLINNAEKFSQKVCKSSLKYVLCHSDIHGGNVLISDQDTFYIVDWDDAILAPKERDLMFIGGGVGNIWNQPYEELLFYQGYGQTDVDLALLAYYRCERIIEDIAVYSEELLTRPTENKDRSKMYKEFIDMFEANGVVDIAFRNAKDIT